MTTCPNHPAETLRPLKYQKPSGTKTRGGNNGTVWLNTGLHWCEACKKAYEVTVTVTIAPIAQ
jgi:hypothetical protein